MHTITLDALEAFPSALERHFAAFPSAYVHWAPASWDGVPSEPFTAIEQVCHVRDIEIEGYQARFRRTLAEARPFLPSIDSEAVARERDYGRARGRARVTRRLLPALTAALLTTGAAADARWCLSMTGLGAVRAGMSVEEVLPLLDWSGLERKQRAGECWYLRYEGPSAFRIMIIGDHVARIELTGKTGLRTVGGAGIGTTETALRAIYGARLDVQPHKYVDGGHTITLRSGAGTEGLRFETVKGAVTAIQAGPWDHLNLVEGCS